MRLKKIFYYVLSFVLVFWLVFFAFGIFKPSFNYDSEIIIDAPRDFAWQVFSQDQYMPEWIGGLEKVELTKGEPDAVGSVYKMTVNNGQEVMEIFEKITANVPAEKFAFELESDVLTGTTSVHFEDAGSGKTKIVANNTTSGKGILWKSLLYVMRRSIKQQSDISYESLKKVIEREYEASKAEPPTER